MTKALVQPVTIIFETMDDATRFRGRCYTAISRARLHSRDDPLSPDYDSCPWDKIEMRLTRHGRRGRAKLLLRVPSAGDLGIVEVRLAPRDHTEAAE